MPRKVPYRSNNNVVFICNYHVVWCTKYRRKVLSKPVSEKLKEIVMAVCQEKDAIVIEFEVGELDHVHLLVDIDPQYGIHRLVKQMKGRSSRLLRQEFAELRSRVPTLWTNSYFVATVGGAPLAVIKHYIEQQNDV
jgi:putative transposase